MRGVLIKDLVVAGSIGDSATATGGRWIQVTQLELSASSTVTLGSAFTPFSPSVDLGQVPTVVLRIRFGIAGVQSTTSTLAGNPKTLSGTHFYVEAQVFYDELGTVLAPFSAASLVQCWFSIGDGQDLQPTAWGSDVFPQDDAPTLIVGPAKQMFTGPGRIRQLQGYNHTDGPEWLMVFDWPQPGNAVGSAPPNGTLPKIVLALSRSTAGDSPAGGDQNFSYDNITSKRDFIFGAYWAASSDGTTFVYDDTAMIHVEWEVYPGDKTQDGM
jgi:hypothetical protein